MSPRGRIVAWGLGALCLCLGAGVAHAGFRQVPQPVQIGSYVQLPSLQTRGFAEGSMGSTRNSIDTTNYLGCSFSVDYGTTWSGECSAKVGTTVKTCQANSNEFEHFLVPLRNMAADSFMRVEWDPATMVCTKLDVWVNSATDVKAP